MSAARMRIRLDAVGLVGLACLAGCDDGATPAPAAPVPAPPWFVDVAGEAGLAMVLYSGGPAKDHILESTGTGCAFVDTDADGLLDVFLVNAWALDEEPSRVRVRGRSVLYRNLGGGRFEDVTERAGVGDDSWGSGVCAGDYDNDGFLDLYVTNFGPNRLYRNRGDGTFVECAKSAGVDDSGWGTGAAFFDADGDGDLDLYVANYIDCSFDEVLAAERTNLWRGYAKVMVGPFGLRGGRDRFFRNRGDGTFEDATAEAGMEDIAEGYGMGVVASDLDNDGDIDLYVANDSNPNFLYRNEGGGRFTEIGSWSGAGVSADGRAQASMGVDAADFDDDGLFDLFTTNFAQDHSTLYRNTGRLLFEDVSSRHDIKSRTHAPLSWGCGFLDVDLDADLDLFLVNGHIYPQVEDFPALQERYAQQPLLFLRRDGRLIDATSSAFPAPIAIPGRGLALGDYDTDGDLDLLVTAIDAPPVLLRNDAPRAGHWLEILPRNRFGSPAPNARVAVTAGGSRRLGEARSGSTFQSQSAFEVHFGLGAAESATQVEVRWPSGMSVTLGPIPADQRLEVREPD